MPSKRALVPAALAAVLALAILPAGCRKKAPSRLGDAAVAGISGPLGVVHAGPRGEIIAMTEADDIVVVFDHPMAPLGAKPFDDPTDVFEIDPRVKGRFRWIGTRTVSFRPESPLPRATAFKVSVPAGTRSIDGFALEEDFDWSFSTLRPALVRHFPEDGQTQLPLETEILLVFNQPVDEASPRPFIAFAGEDASGSMEKVEFTLTRPRTEDLEKADIPHPVGQTLLVRPRSRLKPERTYAIEIGAGLPGREGPLTTEKARVVRFSTFNAFRFVGPSEIPEQNPNESLRFRFSNRVLYKDLVQRLRIEPKVDIPVHYTNWEFGNEDLWLDLPLAPETKYTATLPADLPDEFGNLLEKETVIAFVTGPLDPSAWMTSGTGVVEAYGEAAYPIFAVNTPRLQIRAARLSKEGVIPILIRDRVFSSRESFRPTASFYGFDRVLDLDFPRNELRVAPLALREIEPDGKGFLFLELDTFSSQEWSRYPKSFLQLTELGISGKFSSDNNLIWVSELKTGLPVEGAEVEIRDDRNRVLWRGRTGIDGLAESPGWKPLGLKPSDRWSKPRQWVFARRGDDLALTSSEETTGVEPYRFDIPYDWNPEPEKSRAALFTERGIYRAGETVHLKGVIRRWDKGRWTIPVWPEIGCEIRDPFGKTSFKTKAVLDGFGSFSVDFDSREDAALGVYTVSATLPPDAADGTETVESESFRLEAFRPAEFQVHLRSPRDSYVFGDTFTADIRAAYLFGGAMAGQKASWTLRLNPAFFAPPGYPGFVFGGGIEDTEEEPGETSRLLGSGEGALDGEGRRTVSAALVAEKERRTVSVDLEATVWSPSRRSISNRIRTLVHQGAFYIGLKPSSTFARKGDPLSVQVIAASPEGLLRPGQNITVRLLRREWRSARKAGIGGRYEWISERTDSEIDVRTVRTSADPVEVRFQPDRSGLYLVSAESRDPAGNLITTATYAYVTGADYVPWERADDDMVEIVPDAASYNPGETARLLIKSPYEKAKALVTVERESILRSEILDIDGSTAEIAVPIDSDFIPNVYVSVLLIQGRTSAPPAGGDEDAGKPSFKLGYAGLSVDPGEKRLSVEIRTDKPGYRPGETVEVHLRTLDSLGAGTASSLAVAVVDVGVLNLIGYRIPDPFAAFYGERPLGVQTSESRVHVVGQRHYGQKGDSAGGGGDEASGGFGLSEVQLRGDFKSTAFWNPSVSTDASGEAVLRFTLPDNLTTFRIMAVAQTKDSRFGRGDSDFRVAKPLLLLPALPRFARVGDTFQGGVLLTNNGASGGTVKLSLRAEGLALGDGPDRSIELAPGASKEILYSFTAESPGRARLSFRAALGGDTDGLESIVPVILPRPVETVGLSDRTGDVKEDRLIIPEDVVPGIGGLEVRASASALGGLRAVLDELREYPYDCLEQRLSRALPFLIAPETIRDLGLSPLSRDEIEVMIRATLREAYACQRDNGGFSLWPQAPFDSPFVSAYAVFTLLKATERGIPIDRDRLDSGLLYLRNVLITPLDRMRQPYDRRGWAAVQAFALYDLALAGRYDPALGERLFQERDTLPLFGRAYLLKAMAAGRGQAEARSVLAREFLNMVKVTSSDAHFEEEDSAPLGWLYSSNLRTTAIVLQALIESGADSPFLPGAVRWLVEKRGSGSTGTTQDNVFLFQALNDYYRSYEKGTPDYRGRILLADRPLLEEIFRSVNAAFSAAVPLDDFPRGRELPFRAEKSGSGVLHYDLRMTYAPRTTLPPRDEGFAVFKRIETLEGEALTEIPAGSLAVVTLEIAVPGESLHVVVDDPLPAGFEAVNPSFRTESQERIRRLDELSGSEERPWWDGFGHVEMGDERILLFADSLRPGIHTYRYLVRALTHGSFGSPGTAVFRMYAPETFGRASEQTVKVVK